MEGQPRDIPIFGTLADALRAVKEPVQYLVIGVAPDGGLLPKSYRPIVREAIEKGLNIDSGLHEFLSEDEEFKSFLIPKTSIPKQEHISLIFLPISLLISLDSFSVIFPFCNWSSV